MRIVQWVLRAFEFVAATGLLVLLILVKGMDMTSGYIMRIAVCTTPCDPRLR